MAIEATAVDAKSFDELTSRLAIQCLLADYADAVNRRRWSELSRLFLEDAKIALRTLQRQPLELTGPEALGRFIGEVVARFDFFQFVLLNARLELGPDGDSALGRLFVCEYRWEKSAGKWTQVFGVYCDRYRRIDGRWWFAQRAFDPLVAAGNDGSVVDFQTPIPAFLAGDA
jgi:hypothetical protein